MYRRFRTCCLQLNCFQLICKSMDVGTGPMMFHLLDIQLSETAVSLSFAGIEHRIFITVIVIDEKLFPKYEKPSKEG